MKSRAGRRQILWGLLLIAQTGDRLTFGRDDSQGLVGVGIHVGVGLVGLGLLVFGVRKRLHLRAGEVTEDGTLVVGPAAHS